MREPVRLAILMPVFNEGGALQKALASVAAQASAELDIDIYLVDDGSRTPVRRDVLENGAHCRLHLARHRVNLGQGAALETARRMSLSSEHDVFVTMDSDGQLHATDLPRFCAEVTAGADVVFGSRFMGLESTTMPKSRR